MSVFVSKHQCCQALAEVSQGVLQAAMVTENSPVVWAFKGHGGKIREIPAVVVKVMGTRARIAFLRKEADEWVNNFRTIGMSSLSPRDDQVAYIDHQLALAPAPAAPSY